MNLWSYDGYKEGDLAGQSEVFPSPDMDNLSTFCSPELHPLLTSLQPLG